MIFTGLLQANAFAGFNLTSGVTVSGISSGGYMAGQLHIAFSDTIKGAGIIAAGPFNCARGDLYKALYQCMDTSYGVPNAKQLLQQTRALELNNLVDSIENLKNDRVFLLSGRKDKTVESAVVKENIEFYKQAGLQAKAIKYIGNLNVGHAFPTTSNGNDCGEESRSPWISACNRDIAGEMLEHLLGKLKPAQASDKKSFFKFSQNTARSMNSYGIAYIPKSCRQGEACSLHVALHGCRQNISEIGNAFYTQTGLNEWAHSNNIIIVYPQAIQTPWLGNPKGCWDWWGYTGANYSNKSGAQMRSIKDIIDGFVNNSIQLQIYE